MVPTASDGTLTTPLFLGKTKELHRYVSTLSVDQLSRVMHISKTLAAETHEAIKSWSTESSSAAVNTFRGDIYSGLRALEFTQAEQAFAAKHLVILSGLYGMLRPYDKICPYRLEAAYKLPDAPYTNLYKYWGDALAGALPKDGPIINVTSVEYEKLILPFVDATRIITPRFLTRGKDGVPTFVVVHAKIARGAFARWIIKRGVDTTKGIEAFDDLGYVYDTQLSTDTQPVFVCDEFKGIGLSQRLISGL